MSSLVRKHDVKLIPGVPGVPGQAAVYETAYVPVDGTLVWGSNGVPIGAEFPDLTGGSDRATFFVPIIHDVSPAIMLSNGASVAPGDATSGGSVSGNSAMTSLHWRITARYTLDDSGEYRPGIFTVEWDGNHKTYTKVSP